ncbi:MAG: AAA family ATPase [Acidobacteria bacterium]|nr:AAA family ATPase [Acidobacteriota bacterium]
MGVACAPDDARDGSDLIYQADAALYHAKSTGRSRAASAHEVDPNPVFPKATLRRLAASGLVGRDADLEKVSHALAAVSEGKSQWVLFEGGPGLGKTAMLRTVGKNLERDPSLLVVTAAGVKQEEFRPYYLLTQILVALLSAPTVDGAKALATLTPEQTSHLGVILPRVGNGRVDTLDGSDIKRRAAIFETAARLVATLAAATPLALVLDDLQFADESTLFVLRSLMRRADVTLLVCASAMEVLDLSASTQEIPLTRFRARYERELGIACMRLRPLRSPEITTHLNAVFPRLNAPDTLVGQVASTTQGNPLFLSEIIRKLVLDQKVGLAGQEWAIRPLEEGYLPRSLEEIVAQKIDATTTVASCWRMHPHWERTCP